MTTIAGRHEDLTATATSWPFGENPHYCNAVKRDGSGKRCRQRAGHGTSHAGTGTCRRHGGSTPNGEKAAQAIDAAAAVVTYGLPIETDPHQALIDELYRTAGHVAYLGSIVQQLEKDQLHGPVGGGQGGIPEHKPNVWLQMYTAERKHLADVAKTCIAVGIEERRVRVVEQLGEGIAAYTRFVLERLGVSLEAPATREAITAGLQLIQGGAQAA